MTERSREAVAADLERIFRPTRLCGCENCRVLDEAAALLRTPPSPVFGDYTGRNRAKWLTQGEATPPREAQEAIETLRRERDEARAYAIRLQDAVDMLDAQLSEARMQAEGAGMHADKILQEAAERVGAAEAKLAALDLTPLTALVAQWEEIAAADRKWNVARTHGVAACASQLAATLATIQQPKP